MLLYSPAQLPPLEKNRLTAWVTESKHSPLRIAQHGTVFVVNGAGDTVYLPDGSSFKFEDESGIADSFAAALQRPTKVFELARLSFASGPTRLFEVFNVTCDGKKTGSFLEYKCHRDRKVVDAIFAKQRFQEVKGTGDILWEMVRVLFIDQPVLK